MRIFFPRIKKMDTKAKPLVHDHPNHMPRGTTVFMIIGLFLHHSVHAVSDTTLIADLVQNQFARQETVAIEDGLSERLDQHEKKPTICECRDASLQVNRYLPPISSSGAEDLLRCDVCGKEIRYGTLKLGCETCDWDKCQNCCGIPVPTEFTPIPAIRTVEATGCNPKDIVYCIKGRVARRGDKDRVGVGYCGFVLPKEKDGEVLVRFGDLGKWGMAPTSISLTDPHAPLKYIIRNRCPKAHGLLEYTLGDASIQHKVATRGRCDVCNTIITRGTVMECYQCDWWKCNNCQEGEYKETCKSKLLTNLSEATCPCKKYTNQEADPQRKCRFCNGDGYRKTNDVVAAIQACLGPECPTSIAELVQRFRPCIPCRGEGQETCVACDQVILQHELMSCSACDWNMCLPCHTLRYKMPGGFNEGDVVYCTEARPARDNPSDRVEKGMRGIVDPKRKHKPDGRVNVRFDSANGMWGMLPASISRVDPCAAEKRRRAKMCPKGHGDLMELPPCDQSCNLCGKNISNGEKAMACLKCMWWKCRMCQLSDAVTGERERCDIFGSAGAQCDQCPTARRKYIDEWTYAYATDVVEPNPDIEAVSPTLKRFCRHQCRIGFLKNNRCYKPCKR